MEGQKGAFLPCGAWRGWQNCYVRNDRAAARAFGASTG